MPFSTILEVTGLLSSFRLVLEGRTGKGKPKSSNLDFLEKFLVNNFTLSDAEDKTSGLLNRGDISDLPLLRTLFAICQVLIAEFLISDGLFCFSSIYRFGSFKNPFAMITSLCELSFDFSRFILLVQLKKVISMNYFSSTRC